MIVKHKVVFKDGKILRSCCVSPSPWLCGFLDVSPDEGEAGTYNAAEISAIFPEPNDNAERGNLPVWTF